MYDRSKVTLACFECLHVCKSSLAATCPLCQKAMTFMGKAFKPPKKKNVRQWRKVLLIVKHRGSKFTSCRCWHCTTNKPPAGLSDAKSLYGERRKSTR